MEKVTFNLNSTKKNGIVRVRYRLREGRAIQLCHTSDIMADLTDLAKLNPDGTTKTRVQIYNKDLSAALHTEFEIMGKAYAMMRDKGLDLTTEVFEREIASIKNPIKITRYENLRVVDRFREYANVAEKNGIICTARCRHIKVVSDKLERYLLINGISGLTPQEVTDKHLMEFRDFILNEYKYVEEYETLYKKVKKQNKPQKRLSQNTVSSQMKMLQAFFAELEDSDEITKSPFRKLGREKRRTMMRTLYDEPYFLRSDELRRVLKTDVSEGLQDTKDAFLVQCALGCRISDFQRLGLHSISISEEGIPYVHYIPVKTINEQTINIEVKTPIVRYAFDIIKRTAFVFPILKNIYGEDGYNARIKALLQICKIDRKVAHFNQERKENEYIPLYSVASSKLCRKTHVDLMNKVQVNMYAAGLHKEGSSAVKRYTSMELKDRFALMNAAFGEKKYYVDKNFEIKKK